MDSNKSTVDAFLELLPPATREQIAATAEKHDYERFGPGQGAINAVILTFNVAQHRTLSGHEIASMASACSYSEREIKKRRKTVKIDFELDAYDSVAENARSRGYTVSGIVNRIIKASGLYRPMPTKPVESSDREP